MAELVRCVAPLVPEILQLASTGIEDEGPQAIGLVVRVFG